jgi:hypothetical protein
MSNTDNNDPFEDLDLDFDPEEEEDEFLAGLEDEVAEYAGFDPTMIITLRSTQGQTWVVPATEPAPIRDLVSRANLMVAQNIEYWTDSVQVPVDHVVAPGSLVTLIGSVKGG